MFYQRKNHKFLDSVVKNVLVLGTCWEKAYHISHNSMQQILINWQCFLFIHFTCVNHWPYCKPNHLTPGISEDFDGWWRTPLIPYMFALSPQTSQKPYFHLQRHKGGYVEWWVFFVWVLFGIVDCCIINAEPLHQCTTITIIMFIWTQGEIKCLEDMQNLNRRRMFLVSFNEMVPTIIASFSWQECNYFNHQIGKTFADHVKMYDHFTWGC